MRDEAGEGRLKNTGEGWAQKGVMFGRILALHDDGKHDDTATAAGNFGGNRGTHTSTKRMFCSLVTFLLYIFFGTNYRLQAVFGRSQDETSEKRPISKP